MALMPQKVVDIPSKWCGLPYGSPWTTIPSASQSEPAVSNVTDRGDALSSSDGLQKTYGTGHHVVSKGGAEDHR